LTAITMWRSKGSWEPLKKRNVRSTAGWQHRDTHLHPRHQLVCLLVLLGDDRQHHRVDGRAGPAVACLRLRASHLPLQWSSALLQAPPLSTD